MLLLCNNNKNHSEKIFSSLFPSVSAGKLLEDDFLPEAF